MEFCFCLWPEHLISAPDSCPPITNQLSWITKGTRWVILADSMKSQSLPKKIKAMIRCYLQKDGRRQCHPTPVLLPGKSHGWRSMVGCNPWGRWGLDTTERLHFHFSLHALEKEMATILQCSCLENPRDGGAWWAAVYGVEQSWTWLKRLSSSKHMKRCFTLLVITEVQIKTTMKNY